MPARMPITTAEVGFTNAQASGNCDEPREHAVARHRNVRLPKHEIPECHRGGLPRAKTEAVLHHLRRSMGSSAARDVAEGS